MVWVGGERKKKKVKFDKDVFYIFFKLFSLNADTHTHTENKQLFKKINKLFI